MFMFFLFNFTADIRYYNKERSSCIEIFRCVFDKYLFIILLHYIIVLSSPRTTARFF